MIEKIIDPVMGYYEYRHQRNDRRNDHPINFHRFTPPSARFY